MPSKAVNVLKRLFRNLYFLMFLNGFLIASLFYFRMESTYEDGLFTSIKSNIDSKVDKDDTQDSIIIKAMGVCHTLMSDRAGIFSDNPLGTKADVFNSSGIDLMTTRGACGSYSQVLATVLSTFHYRVRIAQMKADGVWAAHNIVEVETPHGWVVLDPTFDAHFTRPDGRLASFADVKANWPYYEKSVPKDYDKKYCFTDCRYSNWTKVPVIFPAMKGILNLCIGKAEADTFCVRAHFLRVYNIYVYSLLFLYIPIFFFTLRRLVQTKVFPSPDIPFTVRNLLKYAKPQLSRENTELSR